MTNGQRNGFFFFAVVILLVPLFFLNIRSSHDWGDDFAQYISQAINLAEGKPQSAGSFIYNPDYPMYAPPLYPVGFPILLAPVYLVFGNDILGFNYFQTFMLFLFGIGIFLLLSKFMNNVSAMMLMLVAVYNPWMLWFKTEIIADLSFSLFFLFSALAYLKFKEHRNWKYSIGTGLITGFVVLIKPVGIVLIIAFVVDSIISQIRQGYLTGKQLRTLVVLILLPPLVYLIVTHWLVPSSVETLGHFQNLYDTEKLNKRFNTNAVYYMEQFKELFQHTNPDWDFLTVALKSFALVLFLIGFFGRIFNRFAFVDILSLLFIPVVLLFPDTSQGYRYLLPLLPLQLAYIYHGFESVQLGNFNRKAVFVIGCSVCLFQYKTEIGQIRKNRDWIIPGPQEIASQEAFEFIAKKTDRHAVISFIKPRALALYTGRRTLTCHPNQDFNSVDKFYRENNVDYFLLYRDKFDPSLDSFLKQNEHRVAKIWENEKFQLYHLVSKNN